MQNAKFKVISDLENVSLQERIAFMGEAYRLYSGYRICQQMLQFALTSLIIIFVVSPIAVGAAQVERTIRILH